jgi:hypothetical protein
LHFFIIKSVFYKPPEEKRSELNLENKVARETWKLPVQKSKNTMGEVTWCTIYVENCSYRHLTQSNVLHPLSDAYSNAS